MKVRIATTHFHDRRNAEQMRSSDDIEEKRFGVKVKRNEQRRASGAPLLPEGVDAIFRRQAI